MYTKADQELIAKCAGLTASELDDAWNPDGDGEFPVFTREDWRDAVVQRDTILGYWEWVENMLGQAS